MFKKCLLIASMTLIFATSLYANSIGISYQQIIDDRSFGLTGDYTALIGERITFEADAQIQGGDIYNGNINTNFIFDVATVDLKLLVSNKIKGYDLDGLGRSQSLGLAFTLPVNERVDVDVGIGGASSSPFSAPNAYDTLVGEGFAESDIDGKGLGNINPKATGIPFKDGNTLNAFVSTDFGLGIFDVNARGIIELLGDGEKMHQGIFRFKTDGKVGDITITTTVEIGLASYDDVIYRELATVTTAGISF